MLQFNQVIHIAFTMLQPMCFYSSQVMAVILPYTYITEFYFNTKPKMSTMAYQSIAALAAKKFLIVPIRKMP
jgi:hypothetical protein